jgi:Family of unknown function (DUF5686)/CarboxypepD_reg-like domain
LKEKFYTSFLVFLFSLAVIPSFSQYQISGKVTDAETGEGIPFANVYFPGTQTGSTTDFEGYFRISYSSFMDSLVASYVGYDSKSKKIKNLQKQSMDFQLSPRSVNLKEVVILPGENPAWRILRNVIENKGNNDKRKLSAFQYESYNKVEIDVDNISEKARRKKVFKQLGSVFDSMKVIAGEEGKPILPIFVSESLSEVFWKSNPEKRRENIVKTKFKGVGIENESLVSQLIGSTFQEYNFYRNWMTILNKEFVSPISSSWKMYYQYLLTDSFYIGEDFCYKLEVNPKQAQELAFYGTIWITQKDWALKRADLKIVSTANLNYIEEVHIQQELERTSSAAWLPSKNRILLKIGNVDEDWAGLLAKFYTSNKNFIVDQPKRPGFYEDFLVLNEDYNISDEEYWKEKRHDSLTATEVYMYEMIDTINKLPVIKTYVEVIDVMINGYQDFGKVDVGPYIFSYAFNSVEGHRVRMGFRTNYKFSNKWTLSGYGAYGIADKVWKYKAKVDYLFSRRHWTEFSLSYQYEMNQVAILEENLGSNYVFLASTKWFEQFRAYYGQTVKANLNAEFKRGLAGIFGIKQMSFVPDDSYVFAYTDNEGGSPVVKSTFNTTEVSVGLRITKGERFIQNDNRRISLGTRLWPIFTLTYTRGIEGAFGGDFDYDKFNLRIEQRIATGGLGYSKYVLDIGKVLDPIPYPLLNVHLGNSHSLFYTTAAYNLMGISEFVSDQYITLRYTHHFDGNLIHRIPVLRWTKWRALINFNSVFGTLSQENKDLIPALDPNGRPVEPIKGLEPGIPYLEVGYGLENIFKVLRVDAFHRINYLGGPLVPSFGIKFSAQFIL